MERVTFEIERDDVAEALHEQARLNGRSIDDELAALVERTYAPTTPDYPLGMEPLPGEGFVDHIIRISRPGFDLEQPERGLFELRSPFDDAG